MTRPHALLSEARRCAIVAFLLLAGFYGLHWTADLVPRERSFAFVERAFESGVLNLAGPRPAPDDFLRAIATDGESSDCRTLLSVIAPPAGLAETLAPSKLRRDVPRKWNGTLDHCRQLSEIVREGKDGERAPLRARYWHGSVALVATLLHVPSVGPLWVAGTLQAAGALARLFLHGYPRAGFLGNGAFAAAFLGASCIGFLAAAALALRRFRAGAPVPAAGTVVIAVAVAAAFARVGVLPNHTVAVPFLVGRYMFVPLALGLSALVAAWPARGPPSAASPPGDGAGG